MPLILLAVFLIPIIVALCAIFKKSSVQILPFYLLAMAAVQYALGFFGALFIGPWLFRASFFCACAFLVYALFKKQITLKYVLTQAALPLVLLAFCWWLCRGRSFSNWDEFSHWGIALKGMFYEDVLPSVSSLRDSFKNYPPIAATLQYGISKALTLTYREDVLLFIQAFFASSFLAYPIKAIKSIWGKVALLTAMLITPLILYPNFYYETTMDGLLGVVFGFVIIAYLFSRKKGFDNTILALGFFVLCLTKTTGILFAAFAALIILIDLLFSAKKEGFSVKLFAPLIAGGLGTFLAQASWLIHLNINNVAQRWSVSSFSFTELFNLIFKGTPEYRVQTVQNFFKNVLGDFNYGSLLHFPFMAWTILFAVLAALFILLCKKSVSKNALRISWLLCGGGVMYTFLTLGTYLFSFSEYEAVNVASISRYLNTFLMAQLMVSAAIFAYLLQNASIKKAVVFFGGFIAVWFLLVSPAPVKVLQNIIFAPKAAAVTDNNARVFEAAADIIKNASPTKPEKVRVISQYDFGYSHIRLGYHLAPLTFPEAFASITVIENDQKDPWSEYHTPETLEKQLYDNYDYVYIIYLNSAFKENFAQLFENPEEIQEHSLYSIEKQDEKISLRFVEKAVLN